jgi:hypothetical protein
MMQCFSNLLLSNLSFFLVLTLVFLVVDFLLLLLSALFFPFDLPFNAARVFQRSVVCSSLLFSSCTVRTYYPQSQLVYSKKESCVYMCEQVQRRKCSVLLYPSPVLWLFPFSQSSATQSNVTLCNTMAKGERIFLIHILLLFVPACFCSCFY